MGRQLLNQRRNENVRPHIRKNANLATITAKNARRFQKKSANMSMYQFTEMYQKRNVRKLVFHKYKKFLPKNAKMSRKRNARLFLLQNAQINQLNHATKFQF